MHHPYKILQLETSAPDINSQARLPQKLLKIMLHFVLIVWFQEVNNEEGGERNTWCSRHTVRCHLWRVLFQSQRDYRTLSSSFFSAVSHRVVSSLWWLFGRGLDGATSKKKKDSVRYFVSHQPCAKWRGLYFKLGRGFASSPPSASSSQLCKRVSSIEERLIEEKRKDTVCHGKEKTKETDLLPWLFRRVC